MIKTLILTPAGIHKEISSAQIVLPGVEGEFGLLAGHIDFASNLNDGKAVFLDESENPVAEISFKDGVCEFSDDVCRLIVAEILS